jgi:hypothetical protein
VRTVEQMKLVTALCRFVEVTNRATESYPYPRAWRRVSGQCHD